jgi:hypothetical protein
MTLHHTITLDMFVMQIRRCIIHNTALNKPNFLIGSKLESHGHTGSMKWLGKLYRFLNVIETHMNEEIE